MSSFIHKRPHLDIATNETTYLVNEADNPAYSTAECRYSVGDHRCRKKKIQIVFEAIFTCYMKIMTSNATQRLATASNH